MAITPEQAAKLAELREMIAEPTSGGSFTDEILIMLIDGQADGNLRSVASRIWGMKAGQLSTLVDISEGGSSRKTSDLYKAALAMASFYDEPESQDLPVVQRAATTRPIVRG